MMDAEALLVCLPEFKAKLLTANLTHNGFHSEHTNINIKENIKEEHEGKHREVKVH